MSAVNDELVQLIKTYAEKMARSTMPMRET
jgi:hypothetical protein